MLKKVNEKKVLHKVKKQWVVLGTALFALGTAGAYSESVHADTTAGDNHSSSTAVIKSSSATQTSSSAAGSSSAATSSNDASVTSSGSNSSSSTGIYSSASASQPATTTLQTDNSGQSVANTTDDDDISLRDGDDNNNGSSSYPTSSVSVSLTTSEPAVNQSLSASVYYNYDASNNDSVSLGMTIVGSDTGSGPYYQAFNSTSTKLIFANDGNISPINGITNLVQHVQLSGQTSDVSSSVSSYSLYTYQGSLTSDEQKNLKNPANPSSAASTASVLELQSGPYGSNYYRSGDKLWWTFNLEKNSNFSYSVANPYMLNTISSNTPVEITYVNSADSNIASSQWIVPSENGNIYPGDSFATSVNDSIYGYKFQQWSNTTNSVSVSNPSSSSAATISGTFGGYGITWINLLYNKSQVPVYIKYFDSTTNTNIKLSGNNDPTSLSGYVGDSISYSTQDVVNSLTSEGYSLVSGNPSTSLTVNDNSADNSYVFTFVHKSITYNGNNSSYPKGLTKSDFTKSFTRTINFVDSATNSSISSTATQTVTYSRSAVYDEVTKSLGSYSSWSAASSSFPELDAPSINGYGNPSPASVAAQSVDYSDSTTAFSATIAYTKSSAQSSSTTTTTYTPYHAPTSYTPPVGSDAPIIIYSASSSATSSSAVASSSAATNSVASSTAPSSSAVTIKMYNYKTELVKNNDQILIFIEPKYAPNAENGSLSNQFVVNQTLDNGQISHSQQVTLDQYNSMLTASGKQPYTPETLNQAYIERNVYNGILKNNEYKTTFDASIIKNGSNVIINTDTPTNGFNKPADNKLVPVTEANRASVNNDKKKTAKSKHKSETNKHKSQKKAKRAHKHVKKTEHHVTKHTHHVKHDRKHKK